MKNRNSYGVWLGIVSGLLPIAAHGQPELFDEGITLDADGTTILNSTQNMGRNDLQLGAWGGGVLIYSNIEESAPGQGDGGVAIGGSPVSLVLNGTSPGNQGSFGVWSVTQYSGTPGGGTPYFQINDATQDAIFNGVAVKVVNGSLSVGGSPVVTTGTGFNTALASSTPPTSALWTAAYLRKGNVTNGAALATGEATASGLHSVALGPSQTVASGAYSHAVGSKAYASGYSSFANGSDAFATGIYSAGHGIWASAYGDFSFARGYYSFANGAHSSATGHYAVANSYAETAIGRYNGIDPSAATNDWVDTDALFRIGNGSDTEASERSDAVTVRKNGETTLTNKAWKDSNLGVEESTLPGAAGGKALVVDGHTLLNGKVTIAEPQGDISMGIFE